MTVMIQASPRDAAGTLYNIKSEGDEPDITWADFGSLLVSIGGTDLAQKVRATLASVLQGAPAPAPVADPLTLAQTVVQAAFPGAAPVGEQWGNPPVPPMQQAPQMPAAAAAAPSATPVCQHGPKQYKSGQGAKGPWAFWGCTARSDDPTKCEKEWVR